ncbi:MAG: uracil-DNA glycosylase [Pseudomonadota bacterium]
MKKSETPPEAPPDCDVCPRLVAYRAQNSAAHPEWFNGAVPSFGDPDARLLIVGLAPGVTGANRTGRPFTGDWAGDLLYPTLAKFGLSRGLFQAAPDDGIELVDCMITNAVRCVPPQNKPIGAEVNACRTFLDARIRGLPRLEHIITLGKIAHDSVIRSMGRRVAGHPFGHNRTYEIGSFAITSSYHCSRYNTNTGRLTAEMFEAVFAGVTRSLTS